MCAVAATPSSQECARDAPSRRFLPRNKVESHRQTLGAPTSARLSIVPELRSQTELRLNFLRIPAVWANQFPNPMSEPFQYDVFLSQSSKDKRSMPPTLMHDTGGNPVVRDVAERLKKDGVRVWFDEWEIRPGDSIESPQSKTAKIEEGLERSRVLVLCMSANAFGSDWAQLESGTFRLPIP